MFKFRNYDPETGTARKHTKVDEQDTVEKQVEGLAEQVIALDELKRAQELVRTQGRGTVRDMSDRGSGVDNL